MKVEIRITGPLACGKTHLAQKLLEAIKANGIPVQAICKSRLPFSMRQEVEFDIDYHR